MAAPGCGLRWSWQQRYRSTQHCCQPIDVDCVEVARERANLAGSDATTVVGNLQPRPACRMVEQCRALPTICDTGSTTTAIRDCSIATARLSTFFGVIVSRPDDRADRIPQHLCVLFTELLPGPRPDDLHPAILVWRRRDAGLDERTRIHVAPRTDAATTTSQCIVPRRPWGTSIRQPASSVYAIPGRQRQSILLAYALPNGLSWDGNRASRLRKRQRASSIGSVR